MEVLGLGWFSGALCQKPLLAHSLGLGKKDIYDGQQKVLKSFAHLGWLGF